MVQRKALAVDYWRDDESAEQTKNFAEIRKEKVAKASEMVSTELDRLIHEPLRLGIISALAANETMSFNDLKKLLQTTDGNVSVHARKLEDADFIECFKSFRGRTPLTEYKITDKGRKALEKYLSHLEALINAFR